MAKPGAEQLIVKNRRATFDYDIKDRYEAGVSLVGSEVKSMRAGKVDVTDAYVAVERGIGLAQAALRRPVRAGERLSARAAAGAPAAPPCARD